LNREFSESGDAEVKLVSLRGVSTQVVVFDIEEYGMNTLYSLAILAIL